MSKRAKEAACKTYPMLLSPSFEETNKIIFTQMDRRVSYIAGYEQAEQDIITLIESRIGEILGDAQPAPVLRIELQELIKRIKEEEL